jgi:Lrp/AsnC family transcriptional regulator, leucine-responsive regulatory protein
VYGCFLAVSLDDIDRRILAVLEREGRIAMVDLAEKVGLSATPCLRRVKRLEAEGIIDRYAAVIDRAKLGQGLQAFVQVSLADHAEETVAAFQRALLARPEVVNCWATSGATDFLLHVVTSDLEAYGEFALKALLRMPGVKDTRSSFVLSVLK